MQEKRVDSFDIGVGFVGSFFTSSIQLFFKQTLARAFMGFA
jgi:hypothetical protein